jgi:hypothetical protein
LDPSSFEYPHIISVMPEPEVRISLWSLLGQVYRLASVSVVHPQSSSLSAQPTNTVLGAAYRNGGLAQSAGGRADYLLFVWCANRRRFARKRVVIRYLSRQIGRPPLARVGFPGSLDGRTLARLSRSAALVAAAGVTRGTPRHRYHRICSAEFYNDPESKY